ncbi:MAG: ADP-ribosylglycohydrolase family protein [Clostridia bacterium]|nr:ADP-ribosylglycohydrolase family protein [Clostridia bacterium]
MALKMKLNKEEYLNKVHGCWIGKNIGGTLGDPYEGTHDMLDIKGFSTEKGEPAPNDDLDLQLVWLKAMQQVGPKAMSANVLAYYWMTHITPYWNEYGIAKANLEMGLLPPLSGEMNNSTWKYSNGAWIRSEIWACLAPGIPNIAIKYAIMDASVDHGLSEGTYAEIFTASLESMAFFESDIRKLIHIGLSHIPQDCRIARSVKIAMDGYDKKLDWKEVRENLRKDCEDLGWFQAPANVGYVVLGLLYGEGDFKKSLIYTVNCGDDTDCTGATAGAILGITLGADKIPADWKEYIGDTIRTKCINGTYVRPLPKTCAELVERIYEMTPVVLHEYGIELTYTDEEMSFGNIVPSNILKGQKEEFFTRSPYSFEVPCVPYSSAIVEYEKEPVVKPNTDFKVTIKTKNKLDANYYHEVTVGLPEGWTADYNRTCFEQKLPDVDYKNTCVFEMMVHVGETVAPVNRISVMFNSKLCVIPMTIPITLLG